MPVVKWKFIDLNQTGPLPYEWTFDINPDEGGSPTIEKQMNVMTNTGPNRGGILQEGRMTPAQLQFSGVILTQDHYEIFERWYTKRVLLQLEDDLGRKFRGVFSAFSPQRTRRAFNPWFHRYSATFMVWAYQNSRGMNIYGRLTL